jgi:hypothetical protein
MTTETVMPNEETSNPQQHTANVKQMLNDVIRHLREDVGRIEEPPPEALFETTAEVLGGLVKAFDHYERKAEEALR